MPWDRSAPADPKYKTREHREARAALLTIYQPGDPCCLCGHPMWPPTRNLHADHVPGTDEYRGLAHGSVPCETCGVKCNVVDGSRRGRARQDTTQLQW
jgi:hypothetical protein